MKKTIKVVAAIMLITALVFSIASCGEIDINKVKGTWIVSTINGKDPATYAGEIGTVEAAVMKVWDIQDKQATLTWLASEEGTSSASGAITLGSDGVVAAVDGIAYPLKYNEADKTITYTINDLNYVYVKGSYDIKAKFDEQNAAVSEFNAQNEAAEEGGEEYSEEDYSDYSEEE